MAEQIRRNNDEFLEQQLSPYFPLRNSKSVIRLFGEQLKSPEPNLAVLSLVCGFIEHHLTCKTGTTNPGQLRQDLFPVLDLNCFLQMYRQYTALLRQNISQIDFTIKDDSQDFAKANVNNAISSKEGAQPQNHNIGDLSMSGTSRKVIKAIADFVWSQLSTSYFKDRPHIQSLYSFLKGKWLDCFGVALTVVMTAQCLELNDVHLSLSEDHAWVVFGRDGEENAEVTWHGRRDEIKRGSPIGQESLGEFSKDWLYLGGYGMICDRHMEVAAIVSAMNPGIDSKTDSKLLSRLQQNLLWYLFDHDYLNRYPMAICNLADLEEIEESQRSQSIEKLYEKAIDIAEKEYAAYHVYPYTYFGGYLHRQKHFSKATDNWKKAAIAAARYTHSREDEELYKELNEVANTFFPEIVKNYKNEVLLSAVAYPEKSFFDSSQNLMNIIKFYDGVCLWEEGSTGTAIHSEWAKNFSKILSLFPKDVRAACKTMFSESNSLSVVQSAENSLGSRKMKSVLNLIGDAKIKSQIISLHLTAQIGFESTPVAKRSSDLTGRLTTKRYKL